MPPDDKTKQWFERHNLTPPSHTPHGSADDIADKMRPAKIRSWRMEGNRLIAETDIGRLVNYVDPNVVMTGVDENNRPIFKRIQKK